MASVTGIISIPLESFSDPRGMLTPLEPAREIPFEIKRVFFLHGVPEGLERGSHAHRNATQFIMSLCGGVTATCHDGTVEKTFTVSGSRNALLVPPGIWVTLSGFSPGTVCAVFSSQPYDENEIIRSFAEFKESAISE